MHENMLIIPANFQQNKWRIVFFHWFPVGKKQTPLFVWHAVVKFHYRQQIGHYEYLKASRTDSSGT